MKRIATIDGFVVKRPGANHPDRQHWDELRSNIRDRQRVSDGDVQCATCPCIEGKQHGFELHHKHYNNWGKELGEDVVLLCAPCHEAITSRIRLWRMAHGDMTVSNNDNEPMRRSSFVGKSRIDDTILKLPV